MEGGDDCMTQSYFQEAEEKRERERLPTLSLSFPASSS